ncbi:hypothetical protein JCM17844_22760 [Iodidimonas gelatinilytica]|uniref:DUF1465 domain-containing protein n=1 Tax=Iodidimonas gelatinilytica TaxID=1236966 RepID=A0A5A7N136_9PROT|nr:DUF1465 family protein [Iodidimonas gelatinilytica]GEQ98639.1 hypothetical protein JCM17844_22760 [Iodidimonas gelatinilytica]GER01838.1 hypothetical protein JCM17845_24610 [Iodidimonas gelatinilytica]
MSTWLEERGQRSQTAPVHVFQSVDRAYCDAMDMAVELRSFLSSARYAEQKNTQAEAETAYVVETMRMSVRIMHVIAWALARKAVAAGELSEKEAHAAAYRLGDRETCLAQKDQSLSVLSPPTQDLSVRSRGLYQRALRLEAMMENGYGGDGETRAALGSKGEGRMGVHAMWDEIARSERGGDPKSARQTRTKKSASGHIPDALFLI